MPSFLSSEPTTPKEMNTPTVSRFLSIFLSVLRCLKYVLAVSAPKACTSLIALTERSKADSETYLGRGGRTAAKIS